MNIQNSIIFLQGYLDGKSANANQCFMDVIKHLNEQNKKIKELEDGKKTD